MPTYFNEFILKAVDELYANYKLLGYGKGVLTHDIPYSDYGVIKATKGQLTMCVASVMEVILTAMNIYSVEKDDQTVFDHLPIKSWQTLHRDNIKAHLWVNPRLGSFGTGDALRHFGMGTNVPFEDLEPGGFVGFNRTRGTGHATVFIAFVNVEGNDLTDYSDDVIGFKYFSSQGGKLPSRGGLDYRYGLFSTKEYDRKGYPEMPYKRDTKIIRSSKQHIMNTGMMFHPDEWIRDRDEAHGADAGLESLESVILDEEYFDMDYFDGVTDDDDEAR